MTEHNSSYSSTSELWYFYLYRINVLLTGCEMYKHKYCLHLSAIVCACVNVVKCKYNIRVHTIDVVTFRISKGQ